MNIIKKNKIYSDGKHGQIVLLSKHFDRNGAI